MKEQDGPVLNVEVLFVFIRAIAIAAERENLMFEMFYLNENRNRR